MSDINDRIIALLTRKPKSGLPKVCRILSDDFTEDEVTSACNFLLDSGVIYLYDGKKLCISKSKSQNKLNDRRLKEYHTDEHHKILRRTRMRVIRKLNKGKPILDRELKDILGCSTKEFKKHLEDNFMPGMNWDNWGVGRDCWHIDHVVPCAHFDLTDPKQLRKCFHYSNQMPLWSTENTTKGATTRKKIKDVSEEE